MHWLEVGVAVATSLIASSGFWSYISSREEKRDKRQKAQTDLLMGVTHMWIVQLGVSFINKGEISKDEYEDFIKYLYEPYASLGGNGLAKKIAKELEKLPLASSPSPTKQGQHFRDGTL